MDPEQLGQMGGRVIARLAKQLEQVLAPVELSLPQYRVLGFLADGSTGSGALAERMAVTPPTVTSLSDGLVARGLIVRQADPTDRRRLPLSLTPAGTELLKRANIAVGERLSEIAGHHPTALGASVDGLADWQDALDGYRDARLKEKEAVTVK